MRAHTVIEMSFPSIDTAFAKSLMPAVVIRKDLHIVWANPVFEQTFHSVTGNIASFLRYQSDTNVNSMFCLLDKIAAGQPWQGPFSDVSDKKKRHFHVSSMPLPDDFFLLLITEVTEHHDKLDDALHSSRSDRLTGLPNRRHFQESITQAVKQAQRGNATQALLMLDLDGFKPINDIYGHDAGDAVLIETGVRMRALVRETDLCTRLGGDEFACILSSVKSREDVELVADKLIMNIRQPITFLKHTLSVNVSIGIAMIDGSKKTAETIKSADSALYLAKQQGKGCWRYPPEIAPKPNVIAPPIFSDL